MAGKWKAGPCGTAGSLASSPEPGLKQLHTSPTPGEGATFGQSRCAPKKQFREIAKLARKILPLQRLARFLPNFSGNFPNSGNAQRSPPDDAPSKNSRIPSISVEKPRSFRQLAAFSRSVRETSRGFRESHGRFFGRRRLARARHATFALPLVEPCRQEHRRAGVAHDVAPSAQDAILHLREFAKRLLQ
jgi:hypothetical protein